MKSVNLWCVAGLLALGVAGCQQPAATVWNKPNLDKCQKGIETAASQLDTKLFAALKTCKDAYRTAILAGKALTTAATTCDKKLQKALLFPDGTGKSALAKTKAKLDLLVTNGKCTDENLLALGHLPQATFGDLWTRLLLVHRLKAVIDTQLSLVGDTVNIFQQLGSAGCPTCAQVANPPCATRLCTLSPASQFILGAMSYSIGGTISFAVCDVPTILGNNFAVLAGPGQSLESPACPGTCFNSLAIAGYIEKTGSTTAAVSTARTCQDHVVNAPDADECPGVLGAGTLCASEQPDAEHTGVTNGGPCIALTSAVPAAGSSFLLATAQLKFADPPGPAFLLPLTTGAADATLVDQGGVADPPTTTSVGPGSVFDPAQVAIGSLSGGKWVGAIPGLHTVGGSAPPHGDAVSTVVLECQ